MVYTIEQRWNSAAKENSIWCTDGEWHSAKFVGIGAKTPKTWKTEAGARRYAEERWNHPSNVNRITGINKYRVEIIARN